MRRLAVSIILLCTSAFAAKSPGGHPRQPATEAYLSRVGTIIFQTLAPEMEKHPERLSGALKLALQIDPQGHIQVQKAVSTTSNPWVRDTALRVIHAVKLPLRPKAVTAEQGHAPIDFTAEWSFKLRYVDAVVTTNTPAITFIAVDGHSLASPQRQISVSPGRHHLVFRVNLPLLGWTFPEAHSDIADGPLDETFEASHRYTVGGKLTRTGRFTLRLTDETKRARAR